MKKETKEKINYWVIFFGGMILSATFFFAPVSYYLSGWNNYWSNEATCVLQWELF